MSAMIKHLFLITLGIITMMSLSTFNALAQTEDTLGTTLVEGRLIEEKLSAELAEYGHQVQVIQGETLAKLGYSDINEALAKLVPSLILINKSRGDYNSFRMNGNSGVLWLVDGIRVNNRLYGSAYVDTIGIHMIERVEVLVGGEGLFYGTDSTSGVVNIITKKPTPELSGEVGVAYGTYNFSDFYGYVSSGINGHNFLFFASRDAWKGFDPFPERAYILSNNFDPVTRSYDRLNIGVKYTHEFNLEGHNNLYFSLQRNSGKFDNHTPSYHSRVNDREEYIGVLKWDHDVTPNYSYYIKAYYHSWWTKYTRVNLQYQYAGIDELWGYQDWGINILNSIRTDSEHEFLIGLDYQNYWAMDDVWRISAMHEQVWAIFAQFRPHFSFKEDWKLAIGARYNHTDGGSSFIWNISSRLPIISEDRLYLRANIGTSFTLPTAENLFLDEPSGKGNPNLKPQESLAANVGIGTKQRYFDFELGGFYERVKDRIRLDANSVFENAKGYTRVRGYSIIANIYPVDGLVFSGSYVSQRYQEENNGVKSDAPLGNFPLEYAKLSMQWDGKFDDYRYGIGIYNTWMGDIYSSTGRINFGNYWLTDINLYFAPTEKLRITLSLGNVFDTEYSYSLARIADSTEPGGYYYYAAPIGVPFTITGGISYTF
ncbi:MAG: TonB-dependent receptor [Deltaproteobacteria bacterium]|nr:TonB-dependent receptor [Deltaproteobacteria bacterium]